MESLLLKKRLIAYVIDVFILGLLGMVIFLILLFVGVFDEFLIKGKIDMFIPTVYVLFINLLYFLKDSTGASPGKRIMKLKIVNVKDRKSKPSIAILFIRNLLLLLGIIELIIMFINKNGKRLGDILTGTVVVIDN